MTGKLSLWFLAGPALALSLLAPARAAASRIPERAERQQQRIAQGIQSGELTARESARLEGREARLQGDIRAMRRADGGTLTPAERARVQRREDRLSRSIYRQKHDARTR
jgi:hypothetical protein